MPADDALSTSLDLGDFDAVGVAGEIVGQVRARAIESEQDVAAAVAAPAAPAEGWHRMVVTGRRSGHLVLSVRYGELTASRWHNVAGALARRGWQLDDDAEGSTLRYPPGTDATTIGFEMLAALTVGGAPADVRTVTAG
jgi:hypothetical protein